MATAPAAAAAGMTPELLASLNGPQLKPLPVRVEERTSFTGSDGTTVHQMLVTGFGFSRKFNGSEHEAKDWPEEGSMVFLTGELTPTKDGSYRLTATKFMAPK